MLYVRFRFIHLCVPLLFFIFGTKQGHRSRKQPQTRPRRQTLRSLSSTAASFLASYRNSLPSCRLPSKDGPTSRFFSAVRVRNLLQTLPLIEIRCSLGFFLLYGVLVHLSGLLDLRWYTSDSHQRVFPFREKPSTGRVDPRNKVHTRGCPFRGTLSTCSFAPKSTNEEKTFHKVFSCRFCCRWAETFSGRCVFLPLKGGTWDNNRKRTLYNYHHILSKRRAVERSRNFFPRNSARSPLIGEDLGGNVLVPALDRIQSRDVLISFVSVCFALLRSLFLFLEASRTA